MCSKSILKTQQLFTNFAHNYLAAALYQCTKCVRNQHKEHFINVLNVFAVQNWEHFI